MKVKDLIELLKQEDPNLKVCKRYLGEEISMQYIGYVRNKKVDDINKIEVNKKAKLLILD